VPLGIYDDTYQYLCEQITARPAHVLDIGCGPGNIGVYLAEHLPNIQLRCVDAAPAMIELARQNLPDAECEVLGTAQISRISQKFDAITCGFCIPYLTDAETRQLIQDVKALLRPDSSFYLSFVYGHPDQSGYQTNSQGDQLYFQYYRTHDILNILSDLGFVRPRVFELEYTRASGPTEVHVIVIVDLE
jgi:ubiquinone/menaquinone biosynthesis C-methylase UbiE